MANLHDMFSHPVTILLGVLVIVVASLTIIAWETKLGKTSAIV